MIPTLTCAVALMVSAQGHAGSAFLTLQVYVSSQTGTPRTDLAESAFAVATGSRVLRVNAVAEPPGGVSLCLVMDLSPSVDALVSQSGAGAFFDGLIGSWIASRESSNTRWMFGAVRPDTPTTASVTGSSSALLALRALLRDQPRSPTGPSPIWDASNQCLNTLRSESGRRGVLLVTDGRATGNRIGVVQLARNAVAAGVPISSVIVTNDEMLRLGRDLQLIVRPDFALELLAEQTGGRFVGEVQIEGERRPASVIDLLEQALAEFENSYLVQVEVSGSAGVIHQLSVAVGHESLVVRTQRGFMVPTFPQTRMHRAP